MRTVVFAILSFALPLSLYAQAPAESQATKEHQWLKQFVGEWTSTSKSGSAEGQADMAGTGTMRSEMLGDLWVINHMTADMAGTSVRAIQTLGYDPDRKKFVGTWVDSMMNHMWHYEGELDASGKKLVLTAEGPNFMTGEGTSEYRDSYEMKSRDLIVATSEAKTEDGTWVTFMTGEIKRVQK